MFDDSTLVSGRHLAFYAIALIGMLFIGFFRLDELIFRRKPKSRRKTRRPLVTPDKDGLHTFSDPDGTPWGKTRSRK